MTQLDLSARCNIEQSNLARIENGNTNPTIKSVFLIAEALDIEFVDLFKNT